jgi:hypothetical protein
MSARVIGHLPLVLIWVGSLACGWGCASSSYHAAIPSVERTEPNVNRVLRGARRVGCESSDGWDSFLGVLIDCKEGRIWVGHPSGDNMKLPGKPVEIGCSNGLGDQADCMAKWRQIYAAGERPCEPGEPGAGCGELKCTVTGQSDREPTCEEALDPSSPKFCPDCER